MDDEPQFTSRLIGYSVVDAAGDSLGVLAELYTDADTGRVVFGGITMLRRGRRRLVYLPLDSARVDGRTITVRCGRRLVRRAPAMPAGQLLPLGDEPGLYAHYDMAYGSADGAPGRLTALEH